MPLRNKHSVVPLEVGPTGKTKSCFFLHARDRGSRHDSIGAVADGSFQSAGRSAVQRSADEKDRQKPHLEGSSPRERPYSRDLCRSFENSAGRRFRSAAGLTAVNRAVTSRST